MNMMIDNHFKFMRMIIIIAIGDWMFTL